MARNHGKRTRLVDVAREAGVSTMAVSHVLHGTAAGRISVGAEKTARIKAAARSLNYVPNYVAKQLVKGQSNVVGVVVVQPVDDVSQSPVSAWPFLNALNLGDGPVLMHRTPCDGSAIEAGVTELRGHGVCGLVVVLPDYPMDWPGVGSALTTTVPTVCIGRPPMDGSVSCVTVDWAKGIERLVRHLAEVGCHRIGLIPGDDRLQSTSDRVAGYRRGLERAGLEADDRLILAGSTADDHDWAESPADAIIAHDDVPALATMGRLVERGIHVPKDVLVAGGGNQPFSASCTPSLTTLDYNYDLLAKVVVDLLQERREDASGPVRTIRISPELVVRKSTRG